MEEQLIEFDTAKLAQEKGFDLKEPCTCGGYPDCICKIVRADNHIYQPTQSLLQRWLREVHSIEFDIIVTKIGENRKSYDIFIIDTSKVEVKQNKKVLYSFFNFKNYEEVLELGLQEALKLIK